MTDVGLRVRRQDGYVLSTISTRLTKTVGRHDIPLFDALSSGSGSGRRYTAPAAANGAVSSPELLGGDPFFYFLANGQKSLWGLLLPSVTVSGAVITWEWVPSAVNQHTRTEETQVGVVGGVTLVYGVYS